MQTNKIPAENAQPTRWELTKTAILQINRPDTFTVAKCILVCIPIIGFLPSLLMVRNLEKQRSDNEDNNILITRTIHEYRSLDFLRTYITLIAGVILFATPSFAPSLLSNMMVRTGVCIGIPLINCNKPIQSILFWKIEPLRTLILSL